MKNGHEQDPLRFLLGIDEQRSLSASFLPHFIGDLLELFAPQVEVICVTVIPVPSLPSSRLGRWRKTPRSLSPTIGQRMMAEQALRKAQAALQQQGIASGRIKGLIRVGRPADEMVRVATEWQAACIVLGSRGNTFGQRLRRWFIGSTSRRVLRLASCPVMIVTLPKRQTRHDLVAWYERAITSDLQERSMTLLILTPEDVAHQFVPPETVEVENTEVQAAALALEHLAQLGFFSRHEMHGQVRYVND